MKILLTHTPHMRDNYYGKRALAGLSALGDVVLHQGGNTLEGQALIAAAKGCDLIVMSSHGRSGVAALLVGSVTSKVLTHAKIPVLVCP